MLWTFAKKNTSEIPEKQKVVLNVRVDALDISSVPCAFRADLRSFEKFF